MQIADLLEPVRQFVRVFQGGEQDEIVYLAHLAVLFIDQADFARHQKAGRLLHPVRSSGEAKIIF